MSEKAPVFELRNVSFVRGGLTILAGIDWRMSADEHWVLLGPNGSGKSTIASFLCGYQWPTTGRVCVLGEEYGRVDLRDFRARLGIFQPAQQAQLDVYHPDATALDILLTGYDGSLARYRDYPEHAVERARMLYQTHLHAGRLSFPLEREFCKLSSGERRKVLLLRMLLGEPRFLLIDEPFESLDIPARMALEYMLATHVTAHHTPTLTILHRVEEIPLCATHALLLKAGRIFRAGPLDEVVTSDELSALYDTPLEVGVIRGRRYCVGGAV